MNKRARRPKDQNTLITLANRNVRWARRSWVLSREQLGGLRSLTVELRLSVARGDLRLINGAWYVTHTGLMRLAHRSRCAGIQVRLISEFCDPSSNRWVFETVVYKSKRSKGFVGYGDADPSNVSPLVRGAEMRVAETRAVNRALRKAYGIGLCSVEELGWEAKTYAPSHPQKQPSAKSSNGHQNSHPRLRDRLCLLIRQHQLDANLVKAYAADFCGTPNLRDATREQIESFIANLSDWATKDRPALLCKLNSYSRTQEVIS
jgi:hypothetical protein